MDNIRKIVGKKVKELRKMHKLTQAKLADKLDVNIRQISRIEAGSSFVSESSLSKLCEIFKISPAMLFDLNTTATINNVSQDNKLLEELKNKIEQIADNDEKLKFINFVFSALDSEEAMEKLKFIIMGMDLKNAFDKR